jgi:hypothetical protein
MALYKYAQYLTQTDDANFYKGHQAGQQHSPASIGTWMPLRDSLSNGFQIGSWSTLRRRLSGTRTSWLLKFAELRQNPMIQKRTPSMSCARGGGSRFCCRW